MRMRRKKHLAERIDAVKEYLIPIERDILNVKEAIKDKKYIDFNEIFNNDNPIELEIGCGKGGFITALSKESPNKNFIAVEMIENVILLAMESAKRENIRNVRFINSGAEYLPRFIKENSIDAIYLNFSTPYPEKSNANRRLTYIDFIEKYKIMLKKGSKIYLKTDSKDFFEYSKEQFVLSGFSVKDYSDNENLSPVFPFNIKTEYEEKFVSQNLPIYRLTAEYL